MDDIKMKNLNSKRYVVCLICSLMVNMLLISRIYNVGYGDKLSWSRRAAEEAEKVAAISCSGHGRAYLDGLFDGENHQICECNSCYHGHDCSLFLSGCAADTDSGDPLFFEPFWLKHAASSAVVVPGWHRMAYSFKNASYISEMLEIHIRKLHQIVGNAVIEDRFILFGAGSTQLLNAAVHALSPDNSSSPARVVASIPFYPRYQSQTKYFESLEFKFEGDTSQWKNDSDANLNIIEFVTAPNNPDGQMNKAVLHGPNAKSIHDHTYYWPHFAPITAPANEDLMLFTISKLSGHAGSRFGDKRREGVSENVGLYGCQYDGCRLLKLLKVVIGNGGREIFEFGNEVMSNRWKKLSKIISLSTRFSLQEIGSGQYCTFFQEVRTPSPAYAWLKCNWKEDTDCYAVLKSANIISRDGRRFSADASYVRLSLIKRQDDFDLLLIRLEALVSEENRTKSMRRM